MSSDALQAAQTQRSVISEGVGWIGKVAGAAAIIRFLAEALKMPLSYWLHTAVDAYTTLFHPIVDYTVGLVPWLFGLEFLPVVKDLIVLYAVCGAAVVRVGRANVRHFDGVEAVHPKYLLASLYFMLLWPTLMLSQRRIARKGRRIGIGVGDANLPPDAMTDYHKAARNVRLFKFELLTVLAIVVVAVIFNAAGEL